jgi:hypothetical protein
MWWDCLAQNVQCHSHAVGYRKRCDEITFHKICNLYATHSLLAIRKQCDETAFHEMYSITHILLFMGKTCGETAFHKMCNVTHSISILGKMWWNSVKKCAMSLTAFGHEKRCSEAAFHHMCNVTHFLIVISYMKRCGVRLPFTNMWLGCHSLSVDYKKRTRLSITQCAMSLTCC